MKTSRRMRFAVGLLAFGLLGRVAFLGAIGPRPAVTLRGSHVFKIAFSPDGGTLASIEIDDVVNLWDVAERRLRGRTSLAEIPDWARGASSKRMQRGGVRARLSQSDGMGRFRAVELLDVATGEVIARLAGHRDRVNAVAFSPDGVLAATGGGSLDHPWPVNRAGDARLWSVKTGNLLAVLGGHWGPVSDVAFSPDGAILATASYDGSIRLWSVAKLVRGVAY